MGQYRELDMNIDALTLSLSLVVIVIVINVMISYLRLPNVFEEADHRERLQGVITTLRLNKMLALLNIPLEQYLTAVPLNVVNRHVSACRACTELGACDRCLQKGVLQKDMSFCPNHKSLMKQRKILSGVQ